MYRNTGQAAPSSYTVRGNTVYGKNGRKIGNIGKGTAKQQKIIRRAATAGGRKAAASAPGRFSFQNIRKARQRAVRAVGRLQLAQPAPGANQIKNFGKSVKNMALLSIEQDPTLQQKIKNMDDAKLMELYNSNEMIFDVYFDYGGVSKTDKGMRGNRETAKNAQALIDTYEARYGTIPIQSRLPI